MIEVVGLEQTSHWISLHRHRVLQKGRRYGLHLLFFYFKVSTTFEQGQLDTSESSGEHGSQARAAKTRESHLAPGMNKYSTPKAPAEES
jgi:hypothetical protein